MQQEPLRILTANRLSDGVVVYLDALGKWVEQLTDAFPVTTDLAARDLLSQGDAGVQARQVVGPYLFTVTHGSSGARSVSQRENIRSLGPTVGTDITDTRMGV